MIRHPRNNMQKGWKTILQHLLIMGSTANFFHTKPSQMRQQHHNGSYFAVHCNYYRTAAFIYTQNVPTRACTYTQTIMKQGGVATQAFLLACTMKICLHLHAISIQTLSKLRLQELQQGCPLFETTFWQQQQGSDSGIS